MSASVEADLLRLLRRMIAGCRVLPGGPGAYRFERPGKSGRAADLAAPAATVAEALARGLVAASAGGLEATAAGRAYVRRALAGADGFVAQHQDRVRRSGRGGARVTVNAGESPIAWLRCRRGRDGRPLIDASQFAAGERLRADFTRGQLLGPVTANWDVSTPRGRQAGPSEGLAGLNDAALAARQRVEQAVEAVGPDFGGLLVDFCCFLKGIEDIERERQWPARSAKLVLQMALRSLARHYGLQASTRGRPSSAIRHWGAAGYRPALSPEDVLTPAR